MKGFGLTFMEIFCQFLTIFFCLKNRISYICFGGFFQFFEKQNTFNVIISCPSYFLPSGGYTVGPKPLIDLLRQRSRPYLFSNSLPPPVVGCATRAIELLLTSNEIAQSMTAKTMRFVQESGLECGSSGSS